MSTTEARTSGITGIIVSVTEPARMIAWLQGHGINPDADATADQLQVMLYTEMQRVPKENRIRCKRCRAVGDDREDVCPFCGHNEGEEIDVAPEPTPIKSNGSNGHAKEAHTMETEGQPTTKTNVNKRKKKTDETKALAKVEAAPVELRNERDLDTAVKKVQDLKGDAAASGWALGKAIKEIYDAGLWKMRLDKDSEKPKPRWASFEAFCNGELGMTPVNARTMMDVSENYTEAQVRAWGTSKLGLVLTAPAEDRPKLEAKVREGASFREVRDEVRKVKKEKAHTKPSRSGSRGGKTGQKGKASKQITVAQLLGTETVKLFKKPDSMKNVDWKSLARAKRLGDQPVGFLSLTNDVTMFFTVQETAAGELQLKVHTARNEG